MKIIKPGIVTGIVFLAVMFICCYQALQTVKDGAAVYLFGYPLVLMDVTQQVMTSPESSRAPVNHFSHVQHFPDHNFRTVVRPNNDTLYSIAWIDLAAGPLVLSVPDTAGRYYVMPFMDAWTNVFAMVGKRTTGTASGDFLVVGPDHVHDTNLEGKLPENLKVIQAPTNQTWLVGRIQTNGKDDFRNVFKLQENFTLTSFKNWTNRKPNPSYLIKKENSEKGKDASAMVEHMSPETFFTNLSRLMGEQPPSKEDATVMAMLKGFGVEPGIPFNMENLGMIKRILLKKAVEITRKKLRETADADRSSENNWTVIREGIGSYGSNYKIRAFVALVGLGALPPAEAAYPTAKKDSNGTPLSGRNVYRIHFEKGKTPPVDAFWSLTMYDERGFLVDNPIQRYTIGDRDELQYNDDGSLDILIQHARPQTGESNWLPAPSDTFSITMRLYMPGKEFLNKAWQLPPVTRINE